MIEAVIFDFDGVLADSERLHLEAFQAVFARQGWVLGAGEYFDRYMGYDDRDLITTYAADRQFALDPDTHARLAEEKRVIFAEFLATRDLLFPGARRAVEGLHARYRLAVASGALHEEIDRVLTAGGMAALFPVVIGADDVAASKPAPDSYLAAARGLGVDPAACVAVEDSYWGLDSARAAGMRTIALTTTSPAHVLRAADIVLTDIRDVTADVIASLHPRA
jgi:beta-phosphoglucomutase